VFNLGKHDTPNKPKTHDEQMDMVWDALFNHIPTRLAWVDLKVNFILAFIGIVLALVAVSLGLLVVYVT